MCCIPAHLPSFLSDAKMMLHMNEDASHVMFPGVTLPTNPCFPQAVGYETALNCSSWPQLSSCVICLELRLTMQCSQHSKIFIGLPTPGPYTITLTLMSLCTGLSRNSLNLAQPICPCQASILTGL